MAGLPKGIEQAGGLQITDVIRNGVAAQGQVTAQGIVAGLERDALGENVHQFLKLRGSGHGHLGVVRDVVLHSSQDSVLEADLGIPLLEEGIEADAAVLLVVFERAVLAVREINLALEHILQGGGFEAPAVPDIQELPEGQAGHLVRDTAAAEVGLIAFFECEEAAAGIHDLKGRTIVVDVLDLGGPALVLVDLVYVQMLAALEVECPGKLVERMPGEIHIVGRDIEGLVQLVVFFDVLEDESGLAHALLAHDADEAAVPVDLLVETAEIAHRDQRELDAEGVVQILHGR